MTSKQDRQGVRKPSDLEQKYEFGQTLSQLEEASKQNSERISKQGQEMTEFMTSSGGKVSELEKDMDSAEKIITALKVSVSGLQTRMTKAERKERELSADVATLDELVSEVDKSTGEALTQYSQKLLYLESLILDQGQYELLVTVQVDSLNCESISADKTFAEIEEAIVNGVNVRIQLHSASENQVIYLQLASYQAGVEADFCGYYNGLPVVLQILAEENVEST